jgi:hypothetical protein
MPEGPEIKCKKGAAEQALEYLWSELILMI